LSGGWEYLEGRQSYTKSDSEDGDSEQTPAHRGEQLSEWLTLTTNSVFRAFQTVYPVSGLPIANELGETPSRI